MRECKRVRRWMAQSLGGDLPSEEAALLNAHLNRCASYCKAFAAARETATALSDFAARWPRATLSEKARANLKQQVRERGKEPRSKGEAAARQGRASPAWAICWLLALVVGLGGLIWRSREEQREATPGIASGRTGLLTGVVRQVDHDTPLAGATVVAYTLEQFEKVKPFLAQWNLAEFKKANWGCQGRVFLARTDQQGRYTLANVPEGTYIVCVFREAGAYPQTETIQVLAGQQTEAMEFRVGVHWIGHLTLRVRRPDGTPLPHAPVSVVLTTARSGHHFRGHTDAQGRYDVPIPAEGTYEVAVAVEGYLPLKQSDVHLGEGGGAEELDFTLPASAPQRIALSGRVFLPDGKTPAAGVAVAPFTQDQLFPGANVTFTSPQGPLYLRTQPILTTDTEGNFYLADLPPGRYGVVAAPHGFSRRKERTVPDRERLFLSPAASELVEAHGGKERQVVLVLGWGGALTGTVWDRATRQPVAGATVRLAPGPHGRNGSLSCSPAPLRPTRRGPSGFPACCREPTGWTSRQTAMHHTCWKPM